MWGRQNQKEAHEIVAKATKSMAKRTSSYFFLTRFFEAEAEAGCKSLKFNMGKAKPERSP